MIESENGAGPQVGMELREAVAAFVRARGSDDAELKQRLARDALLLIARQTEQFLRALPREEHQEIAQKISAMRSLPVRGRFPDLHRAVIERLSEQKKRYDTWFDRLDASATKKERDCAASQIVEISAELVFPMAEACASHPEAPQLLAHLLGIETSTLDLLRRREG